MANTAGVRFEPSGRVHYVDAGELDLSPGDVVEVATEDGPTQGRVVFGPDQLLHSDLKGPMDPVLRRVDRPTGSGLRLGL